MILALFDEEYKVRGKKKLMRKLIKGDVRMDKLLERLKNKGLWKRGLIWALLLGLIFTFGRAMSNGTAITVGHLFSNMAFWVFIGTPIYVVIMAVMGKRD